MRLLLVTLAITALTACGTQGAPQPPSLNIPKPVSDLSAMRKGETVTLSWTAPNETTDGALVHHSGKMIVRRATSDGQSNSVISEVPLPAASKSQEGARETLKDSLGSLLSSSASDFVLYTVEVVNNSYKSGGQSNQIAVPLVLTPTTPKNLDIRVVPQGVGISWNQGWPPPKHTNLSMEYVYRIMRRAAGSDQPPIMIKQLNAGNESTLVIDTGIQWEKTYQYWVTPVTLWQKDDQQKGEIEGDDSPISQITANDVFPPVVPSGLQAVFSQVGQKSFIDLTWTPNSDADLAGYNVYRRTAGAQSFKINTDLMKTPSFRDEAVQPGMKYLYSVTAVDLRNNESAKSAEASETVPKRQ